MAAVGTGVALQTLHYMVEMAGAPFCASATRSQFYMLNKLFLTMQPRDKWRNFCVHLILNTYVCVPVLEDIFLIQQEVHTSTGLWGHWLPGLGGSPIVWKLHTVYKYKIWQERNVAHIHQSFIIHDAFLIIHDDKRTHSLYTAAFITWPWNCLWSKLR